MNLKYKRVLLKLSGESLKGENTNIDFNKVINICNDIKHIKDEGVEIAIVIGGGNIWRGRNNLEMDKVTADNIGMLATVMNALALKDGFRVTNTKAVVQNALEINKISEFYNTSKTIEYLENGNIVIFGGGTSNPFFSTDTGAALRAAEIKADVIIKASNVDGIYEEDPNKNPNAKKIDTLKFSDILNNDKIKIMDLTAATLCMENNIPIIVLNFNNPDNIIKALQGEKIGTLVN